jgi:phage repressor protein C with HTH and peptisase S24 domain
LSSPIYLSKILILRMSKQNKPSYSASGARAHTELVFSRWPAGGAGENSENEQVKNSENCWVYGVSN